MNVTELDIPILDLTRQASAVPADVDPVTWLMLPEPFGIWNGAPPHESGGTLAFYTQDRHLERIYKADAGPRRVLDVAPLVIVEPNFTINAVGFWPEMYFQIFRKRRLGEFFQSQGIHLYVDIYVPGRWLGFALDGVPEGWNSYMTRGKERNMEELDAQYAVSCARAGFDLTGDHFVVYEGGARVRAWCAEHQCRHLCQTVPTVIPRRRRAQETT